MPNMIEVLANTLVAIVIVIYKWVKSTLTHITLTQLIYTMSIVSKKQNKTSCLH